MPGSSDIERAARRAFIRSAHPDRGGDPEAFAEGLARFDPPPASPTRPGVYRSRRPARLVVVAIRSMRRRLAGRPPRRLR